MNDMLLSKSKRNGGSSNIAMTFPSCASADRNIQMRRCKAGHGALNLIFLRNSSVVHAKSRATAPTTTFKIWAECEMRVARLGLKVARNHKQKT